MKIYHKFLLYQNKLLKPYVRILLGLVEALTYLASLLLIVGVIYEHGFPLSVDEVAKIHGQRRCPLRPPHGRSPLFHLLL